MTTQNRDDVRTHVREGYGAIARATGQGSKNAGGCCSGGCCGGTPVADLAERVGYSEAELATLPEGANMGAVVRQPDRHRVAADRGGGARPGERGRL